MATEAQKKANKKYRDKGKRMTLDFAPTEMPLWEHISAQPNKQGYIKALIRADMERGGKKKMCLYCGHSISADAPDGSQVLVCFDRAGHEGKEMIVGDDEHCANYNGTV